MIRLALQSLRNRLFTVMLSVFAVAVSVVLVLSVERVQHSVKENFQKTISGAHMLVGARSGPTHILLYTVFGIGQPVANMSWTTFEKIRRQPIVDWAIPVSLGDNHRGYRVFGTDHSFFQHFRYGDGRSVEFSSGGKFSSHSGVVIGADVALEQGYSISDEILLSHGVSEVSFEHHDEHPFRIVGILKKTGTPLDRQVFCSIDAIERIHSEGDDGHEHGHHDEHEEERGHRHDEDEHGHHDEHEEEHDHGHGHEDEHEDEHDHGHGHEDEHEGHHDHHMKSKDDVSITSMILRLKEPSAIPQFQREVNTYEEEPLTAVLPSMTLLNLWKTMAPFETALKSVSLCVVIAGILSVLVCLMSSLESRRREMAILRAVGASPFHLLGLLVVESLLIVGGGALMGWLIFVLLLVGLQNYVLTTWGINLIIQFGTSFEWQFIFVLTLFGVLAGLVPGIIAYRSTLADGLSPRV